MGRFEENASLLNVCPFSLGISIHNDKENDYNGRWVFCFFKNEK